MADDPLADFVAVVADQSWRDDALCKGFEIVDFFPETEDRAGWQRPPAVCDVCPVQRPCLEFALRNNELGFWGNTSERARRRIRRQRRTLFDEPTERDIDHG